MKISSSCSDNTRTTIVLWSLTVCASVTIQVLPKETKQSWRCGIRPHVIACRVHAVIMELIGISHLLFTGSALSGRRLCACHNRGMQTAHSSADSQFLVTRTKSVLGTHNFAVAGPLVWNSLPANIHLFINWNCRECNWGRFILCHRNGHNIIIIIFSN